MPDEQRPSASDERPSDERSVSDVPDERPLAPSDEPAVPTEPAVPDGSTVGDQPVVPDETTLARIATPGIARRAPRYGAFIGVGGVLGFVVGVVLATALDRGDLAGEGGGVLPFLGGSTGARLVTGLAVAVLGVLVGALLALWADARSRRRAHRAGGSAR